MSKKSIGGVGVNRSGEPTKRKCELFKSCLFPKITILKPFKTIIFVTKTLFLKVFTLL